MASMERSALLTRKDSTRSAVSAETVLRQARELVRQAEQLGRCSVRADDVAEVADHVAEASCRLANLTLELGQRRVDGVPAWVRRVPCPRDPLPHQATAYLEWLQLSRTPGTVRVHALALRRLVGFMGWPEPISGALSREVIRRHQVALAELLPNPQTRHGALVALRGFLSYAYGEGWLAEDLVAPGRNS